jgi:hypothetical protein
MLPLSKPKSNNGRLLHETTRNEIIKMLNEMKNMHIYIKKIVYNIYFYNEVVKLVKFKCFFTEEIILYMRNKIYFSSYQAIYQQKNI